jgi:Zn-finger nucleic acid-binding protein
MRSQTIGAVEVDRCLSCGGLWLDVMERDKLLEAGAAALVDTVMPRQANAPKDRTTKCPRDRSSLIHMVARPQSHISYESCTVCGGVFFDAGELKDLSEFTLRERVRSMFRR